MNILGVNHNDFAALCLGLWPEFNGFLTNGKAEIPS